MKPVLSVKNAVKVKKKLYRAVPFFLKPNFFNSPFIKEVMPHRLYTQDITKAFLKMLLERIS